MTHFPARPPTAILALLVLLLLVFLSAGCSDEGRQGDRAGAGRSAAVDTATRYPESSYYVSEEGRFKVVWPSGCATLHTRMYPVAEGAEELDRVYMYCDRVEEPGEGCAVTTYLQARGEQGGPPTPRTVVELIKQQLASMNLEIISQHPQQRGPLEGVQAVCRDRSGRGAFWIEGFLLSDVVYLLMAWQEQGEIQANAGFRRFFNSFQPWVPPSGSGATQAGS
jgi:hypothetical protein